MITIHIYLHIYCRDENGERGREGREPLNPPHYDRREGMTPTGNQQPQPRDLTPERSRRTMRGIKSDPRGEKGRERIRSGAYDAREPARAL